METHYHKKLIMPNAKKGGVLLGTVILDSSWECTDGVGWSSIPEIARYYDPTEMARECQSQ